MGHITTFEFHISVILSSREKFKKFFHACSSVRQQYFFHLSIGKVLLICIEIIGEHGNYDCISILRSYFKIRKKKNHEGAIFEETIHRGLQGSSEGGGGGR